LGPEGDVRAQLQRFAQAANAEGDRDPVDMVYPLHAEGGDGGVLPYYADDKTGLEPTFPVFDLNGDGKFNDADKVTIDGTKRVPVGIYVGRGQGSQPVLFKDTVFITTAVAQNQSLGEAGGALHALDVNIPKLRIRVESWKHE
jgi:hypothetical protein